jgi:hypothetical protein
MAIHKTASTPMFTEAVASQPPAQESTKKQKQKDGVIKTLVQAMTRFYKSTEDPDLVPTTERSVGYKFGESSGTATSPERVMTSEKGNEKSETLSDF